MKWNWGYGIALFYILFVLMLAFQLFRSFQYDRSLVVDDYYAKDLAYQEQFDRLENVQTGKADLSIQRKDGKLVIRFPDEHLTPEGDIHFYRPDNKSLDRHIPISINDDRSFIQSMDELVPGKWKIKVNWTWAGKEYFVEKETVIP